ncbi:MAG: hypothetical protein ABSB23_20765 [Bryobacteraceae bacterium]|jgi:hypothetical protein
MRFPIAALSFLMLAASVAAQPASERIGIIDFYGYGPLDPARLRAALPFKEGDAVPSKEAKQAAQEALVKLTARAAARIEEVCCLEGGRVTVFVGLSEPDAPPVRYNPEPSEDIKLPKQAHRLFVQLEKDTLAAVKKGDAGEDDSEGYALMKNPDARGDQLKIRDWVRANVATTHRVLETSRYSDERADAAEALGYAEQSPEQIGALVRASFDADEGVRDNAIRALEVLCNLGPEVTRRIPAARFVPMLHSLAWTDRNKASALFLMLSASRSPVVLDVLRAGAMQPLREMAQWRDWGHGGAAAVVLARLAGIPDNQVTPAKVPEILKAVQ